MVDRHLRARMPRVMVERIEPNETGAERELLEGFLDYHRATLLWKCEGMTAEQLRQRSVPTTTLTLLGLVRHMIEVERGWFRGTFKGEDTSPIFYSDERPDDDFDDLGSMDPDAVFAMFEAECQYSREVAAAADLDDIGAKRGRRRNQEFSLRWIFVHMIEEYARHNGHADLIREAIDGATGE